MATNNITLVWDDTNEIELGHKIYRSDSPMSVDNMPASIATLDANTTTFVDEDLTVGNVYYYRVSAYINGDEQFSEEISIEVSQRYSIYTVSNDDSTIRLNSEGIEQWISTQHTDNVNDVAIDNDNNVFTVSSDNLVIMTDSDDQKIWEFDGHSVGVNSVSVNNGGHVFTGDNGGTLKKIDYNGNELWSIQAHNSSINQVYADYGDIVYTISSDGTIKRYTSNGVMERMRTFDGTPTSVKTNIYTSDIIVSVGNDIYILNYDLINKLVISEHSDVVNEVVFDKNGFIISGSNDSTVKKIDFDGTVIFSYTNDSIVTSVTVNEDGNVFLVDNNFALKRLNDNGDDVVWTYTQHTDTVNRVNITRLIEFIPSIDLTSEWEELLAPTPMGLTISSIEKLHNAPTVNELTDEMIKVYSKPSNVVGEYDESL